MMTTLIGLCPTCKYARVIKSARGSQFIMCNRAKFDDRFPKYPVLPVLACPGYEQLAGRNTTEGAPDPA